MEYMKFCPHCGNGNEYQMPFCIYCGRPLIMGDSIDYKSAKKSFNAYMDAHSDEKKRFDQNHFQICQNCHRKCPLNMDFCAWCGNKLDHEDQYKNYRFIVTTTNGIPKFTYSVIGIVSCTVQLVDDGSDLVNKAVAELKAQSVKQRGNTVLGFHLVRGANQLIAYGTAAKREPLNNQ